MQLTHTHIHTRIRSLFPLPFAFDCPFSSCSLLCLDFVCVVYKSNNQSISLELHLFILLSKCRYTYCLMPLPSASSICLHLMMLYINCGRILGSFCSFVLRGKLIFFFATALHGSSNRCVSLYVCVCVSVGRWVVGGPTAAVIMIVCVSKQQQQEQHQLLLCL